MPIPLSVPATPEFATPDHCAEAIDEYTRRLHERSQPAFDPSSERAKKVASDLHYIESNLAYWLGFLVGPDGSSTGIVSEVLDQIEEVRTAYAAAYTVPDIEGEATRFAKQHARRPRASAREAAQKRQQARSAAQTPPQPPEPPLLASTTGITLSATESALARSLGMTPEQFRAYAQAALAATQNRIAQS